MANNEQNDIVLPGEGPGKRRSSDLLPRYFRTNANKKFLGATLDQLIQPGVAEKLNGYFGRTTSKAFQRSDSYIDDVTSQRQNYQFEPATVIKDSLGNVNFYKDYNDYINQLNNFGGDTSDHSKLNSQESYAWNPNIDWDKFVNFREYYWLPTGPQAVPIRGQAREVQSTYTVTTEDNLGDTTFVFSPNGFTQNPKLRLYRGQTYRFEIDTPGHPMAIAITRTFVPGTAVIVAGTEGVRGNGLFGAGLYDGENYDVGDFIVLPSGGSLTFGEDENVSTLYPDGIIKLGEEGEEVANAYIEKGTIEFTIPLNAPDKLYYISKNDINTSGVIDIYDIEENTEINVVTEILGKKEYVSSNNVELSNGMLVYFQGQVTPAEYSNNQWYVEGVGDRIKLIKDQDLTIPASYTDDVLIPFDTNPFDRLPWSNSSSYAGTKDYIVINRASIDGNAWSRYNRWFHRDVIEESARINGQPVDIDQDARAKRPIIEFEPGIKLFNFGTLKKKDVDVIDTYTKDVFSTIEGSYGYNIDGVDLAQDMRILFTADTDNLVKGKIYKVNFITIGNNRQISLLETEDTDPYELETVLVTQGTENAGKSYYFDGNEWKLGQEKTETNQSPMFDMFDPEGDSYADIIKYESSSFVGNPIFTYMQGEGTNDTELGFPLSYRNIENSGDILFNFDLLTSSFTYQDENGIYSVSTNNGYLKKYRSRAGFNFVNGWSSTPSITKQKVIRQYVVTVNETQIFEIDVYNKAGDLNDLKVQVFVNNVLQIDTIDYKINRANGRAFIYFVNNLKVDDNVIIKSVSSAAKNTNGYYEIPYNLERNPLNQDITEFTLGEVIDHVATIVENIDYAGEFPGPGNLRDLGELDHYGRRFLKHSGPINLPLFHFTSKDYNIVKAMRHARTEYGKFKRIFLQTAETLGYDGPVKQHVDLILETINQDKSPQMPYYFSDMLSYGPSNRLEYKVLDARNPYYAITMDFSLDTLSNKSITIYLNGEMLIHGKDYTFENGFALIEAGQEEDDMIEIYEYASTDGSYIPPTPTKLGIWPSYHPQIYIDDTYVTPIKVVQGHDGSISVAFEDYRDELLLELEKRIFNNIKQKYNPNIFDIHDYQESFYRNTGLTNQSLDNVMLKDFVQWIQLVDADYTDNPFYSRDNQFTYNYSSMVGPESEVLPGFWRAVYKKAYDTDRPHSHPWEMLGFSIKPTWWNEVYGPAPYTSDNLILWQDLSEGVIREPGNPVKRKPKYVRPGLLDHIPVDKYGKLLSPQASNFTNNFIARFTRNKFKFGDHAPVETAWRRSSDYPFAFLLGILVNRPADVFAKTFDTSRIKRNYANQLVYSNTDKHVELDKIVLPNIYTDTERTYTTGLVNYIFNLIASDVLSVYSDYADALKSIRNQMGIKIGGFTDKTKFKLVLDSRSPTQSTQGGVFVPDNNYKIFLNTSSPTSIINYSGVTITKTSSGYQINGYDFEDPKFKYFSPIDNRRDVTITVGGVSENFVEWQAGRTYYPEEILRNSNKFYRVKDKFTSADTFTSDSLAELAELPIVGGRRVTLRRLFNERETLTIPYGTILRTTQDVVDFLSGYGKYLQSVGFDFNYFNIETEVVENWDYSIKEFAFFTTQNFAEGTALTISPAASRISFTTDIGVIDNIFDEFYDYSLLNADGRAVEARFSSILRSETEFGLELADSNDGIYNVKLPIVQKEHVVLLDNKTEFNDIIYQPRTGYRQDRIKVLGYRSDNWTGGFNIPGFVYDDVVIHQWKPYTDFKIGEIVKYKEFYYTAIVNAPGTATFESNKWAQLNEKPESDLLTNFDYRISQFADFYDLDSDNFDAEQQKLAQHLVGYQKREYLRNIVNDDVSQFKFYSGFIQDKGTLNALTKLFDALGTSDRDSLEFFEEWAIQVGRFGATERQKEVEFTLDEEKFVVTPQPILLTNDTYSEKLDKIYRLPESSVYNAPSGYTHSPFPTLEIKPSNFEWDKEKLPNLKFKREYIKSGGYVDPDDVEFRIAKKDDILNVNIETVPLSNYVWVVDDNGSWDVLQHVKTNLKVNKIEIIQEGADQIDGTANPFLRLTLNRYPTSDIQIGSIVGVKDAADVGVNGFYYVVKIARNILEVEVSKDIDVETNVAKKTFDSPLTRMRSVRGKDLEEINNIIQEEKNFRQKVWVDEYNNGNFLVVENNAVYAYEAETINPSVDDGINHQFAKSVDASSNNRNIVIGSPKDNGGRLHVYKRSLESGNLSLSQTIEPPEDIRILDAVITLEGNVTVSSGNIITQAGTNASGTVSVSSTGSTITLTNVTGEFDTTVSIPNDQGGNDYVSRGGQLTRTAGSVTTALGANSEVLTVAYTERPISFGTSVAITPDANFIFVGTPDATDLKTRFVGDFEPTVGYVKGDIVKYRESLWQVNREILPQTDAAEFETFSSYAYVIDDEDTDSSIVNLLVSGAPGLEDQTVDHILIRAPLDMYLGTKPGDQISLTWNVYSVLHPDLGAYLPWLGTTTLQPTDITGNHIIAAKIDIIFYIDTFITIPQIGDIVTTPTGACEVHQVILKDDSCVVYGKFANGTFDISGALFINDEDFVGNYDQGLAYNAAGNLGGFWYINTVDYNNGNIYFDTGRGLIYNDLIKAEAIGTRDPDAYYNIQNLIQTAASGAARFQAAVLGHTTHLGTQTANPGEVQENATTNQQIRQTYQSDLWFLRASKEYTDTLTIGKEFELYLVQDGYDAADYGFDIDYVRGKHNVFDLWDGYIDFEFNNFDFAGFPFEPKGRYKYNYSTNRYEDTGQGDYIEDIQTPFDGFGGLALTSTTTSRAEVMLYQRDFNKVRVYIKFVSGTWSLLNNIGRYELRRVKNDTIRPVPGSSDVNRVMGVVVDYDAQVSVKNGNIGQFIVLKNPNGPFPIASPGVEGPQPLLVNEEYWFFNSRTTGGIARDPNPPYALNKDYRQIYSIPVDAYGTSEYTKEGALSIYRRRATGDYEYIKSIVSSIRNDNRFFGNSVQVTQDDLDYTIIVSSRGSEAKGNSGTVEVFKHGFIAGEGEFKGEWSIANSYNKDDVVTYLGQYYTARKDITQNPSDPLLISNATAWDNRSFRYNIDKDYRGPFENTLPYKVGEMVIFDGHLYSATTNVARGASFDITDWSIVTDPIDYLGYLPNNLGFTLFNDESTFDPLEDVQQFAKEFDISENGQILAIVSEQKLFANYWTADPTEYEQEDSSTGKVVLIYKLTNSKFVLDQVIQSPTTDTGWANSISLSRSGRSLAISEPLNDETKIDQGKVNIYTSVNGQFTLTQSLKSPGNEEAEQFGTAVFFDNDQLAVSSLNGDIELPTTFDSYRAKANPQPTVAMDGDTPILAKFVNDPFSTPVDQQTTFDGGFTAFQTRNIDSGSIYIYEIAANGALIYSEKFTNTDTELFRLGENLMVNGNHVYVGMPDTKVDTRRGKLLDYRKAIGSKGWIVKSKFVKPVDVNKIESVFLYNKRTDQFITYLDWIDPIQGKIPGAAEAELTYKLPYDPALYNIGNIASMFSETSNWGAEHVGQLWWDTSTARFDFPYQGTVEQSTNRWNKLLPGFTVDIYEWVESDKIPSEWDSLVGTTTGLRAGITGETLYSDALYTQKIDFDPISQTFGSKYYFWVKNTAVVPNVPGRSMSGLAVGNLIADPAGQGYKFVAFLGSDRLLLNNIDSYLINKDVVLSIRYTDKDQDVKDVHNQYQIISDGLETSKPNRDIERKWFDSLIGYDEQENIVPDPKLPAKVRYGNRFTPRQSMFVNKTEALKQVIERVNDVLIKLIVTDDFDISPLSSQERMPSLYSKQFDRIISSTEEFRFIGTKQIETASFTPVIINGKIVRVIIDNPGYGYKDPTYDPETSEFRAGPNLKVTGKGSGAEFETRIDDKGRIIEVVTISQGKNYTDDTLISIREFTVLVESDPEVYGKWALYTYNTVDQEWFRSRVQKFNTGLFWNYVDWYAEGYNAFTQVDYNVENSYQLDGINARLGSIVKINNIGSGGWLLLRKTANIDSEDYTVNYDVIGRQDGTIQFSAGLYDLNTSAVGYGSRTYDSYFYDSQPINEIRIILQTIRDNLFVDQLSVEWNQLFMSSLRYALAEQKRLDWAFKTSFIKARHNLGTLRNDITFNNDNLPSYEEYIREAKPYKTNIREYISAYDANDNTRSSVTDFDNQPDYDNYRKQIVPSRAKVIDDVITNKSANTNVYPRKFWADNAGYSVTSIDIANPGSGYTYKPTVEIIGGGGTGATAEAFLGNGKITKIKVTNPGKGYISKPIVSITGSQTEAGEQATASVILGNALVRTTTMKIKFDRTSGQFFILNLDKVENAVGTGANTEFDLQWPMDLDRKTVTVSVNGIDLLRSEYTFTNVVDNSKSYQREHGRISFTTPPATDAQIVFEYTVPLSMLSAADRVKFGYKPVTGMAGNDLAQVMDGIDYGGVEVRSFDFGGPQGWGSEEWYLTPFDTFDQTYEDETFIFDGSTIVITLSKPLEEGTNYNVYRNGVRLDDPNFGTPEQVNTNAIIQTIVGDGTQQQIFLDELGIFVGDGDTLVIRKESSDGSIKPNEANYDTALSGGDLAYSTAKGTRPEDIIVDGDGFVTPTTSKGPEEMVPGQVLDTLDLKVYTRSGAGQGMIYTQSYITDGITTEFDLGVIPANATSVVVKLDNRILTEDEYIIDWTNNKIVFDSPDLPANLEFNILAVSKGERDILDNGILVATGDTADYITPVDYQEGLSAFVTVNGVQESVFLIESGDSQGQAGKVVIRFPTDPEVDSVIHYSVFYTDAEINYSQISKDVFNGDGSTVSYTLTEAPKYAPLDQWNVVVKVGNKVLNPGYNKQFTIDNRREYQLETFQAQPTTIAVEDIRVFINGEEKEVTQEWRFDIFNSSVVLFEEVGDIGDTLEVYVLNDGEYSLDGTALTLNDIPSATDLIEVYRFTNHDIVGLERINYDVVQRSLLETGSTEYSTYHRLTKGEIKLRYPAVDSQYVWISLNGELLTPNVDYYVTERKDVIQITPKLNQNDVIDIIHFSAPVVHGRFAFRQFKDMLNRVHYKRLDEARTVLAQDLNYFDLRIEVENGALLPEPNKSDNIPGIIFIEGERIEYLVKDGNSLRQLRRGTLGTGTLDVVSAGTPVFDQGPSKTVPYKDTVLEQRETGDGTSVAFPLNFKAFTNNEFEVFVAGRRLRKTAIAKFDPELAQDSPEGDIVLPAEFSIENDVDGQGNVLSTTLVLDEPPGINASILIVKKTLTLWSPTGQTLAETDNSISQFLRAGIIDLPE